MRVTEIIGSIDEGRFSNRPVDWVELDWDQLGKRILRIESAEGRDIAISLEQPGMMRSGHVLAEDGDTVIAVRTVAEDALVYRARTIDEMGRVAFEIGNRHTPCVIEEGTISVRFDPTLVELLEGIDVEFERTEYRFAEPIKYGGHHH